MYVRVAGEDKGGGAGYMEDFGYTIVGLLWGLSGHSELAHLRHTSCVWQTS